MATMQIGAEFFFAATKASGQYISVRSNHKFEAPRHIRQQLYQWYIFFFTNNFSSTIYINLKQESIKGGIHHYVQSTHYSPHFSSFPLLLFSSSTILNTTSMYSCLLTSKIKGSMNGMPS